MHESIEYAQINAQRIKELISGYNRPGITFLDVGCGSGAMTYYLQEVFFESNVVGIDKAEKAVQQACKNYPEIKFLHCDVLSHEVSLKAKFDVIVAVDVLHHVLKKDRTAWISGIMAMLKPSGTFIVFELNPWNYTTKKIFKMNPEEKDAQMLSYFQTYQLLKKYGKPNFYSFGLPWPFFYCESWLTKIPLGQQYAFKLCKIK